MEPKKLNFTADDITPQNTRSKQQPNDVQKAVKKVVAAEGFTSRDSFSPKVDGRSLRKTNRSYQLNIGVSATTKDQFWEMASEYGAVSGGDFLQTLLDHFRINIT